MALAKGQGDKGFVRYPHIAIMPDAEHTLYSASAKYGKERKC